MPPPLSQSPVIASTQAPRTPILAQFATLAALSTRCRCARPRRDPLAGDTGRRESASAATFSARPVFSASPSLGTVFRDSEIEDTRMEPSTPRIPQYHELMWPSLQRRRSAAPPPFARWTIRLWRARTSRRSSRPSRMEMADVRAEVPAALGTHPPQGHRRPGELRSSCETAAMGLGAANETRPASLRRPCAGAEGLLGRCVRYGAQDVAVGPDRVDDSRPVCLEFPPQRAHTDCKQMRPRVVPPHLADELALRDHPSAVMDQDIQDVEFDCSESASPLWHALHAASGVLSTSPHPSTRSTRSGRAPLRRASGPAEQRRRSRRDRSG